MENGKFKALNFEQKAPKKLPENSIAITTKNPLNENTNNFHKTRILEQTIDINLQSFHPNPSLNKSLFPFDHT
jgi:hypothetical protein